MKKIERISYNTIEAAQAIGVSKPTLLQMLKDGVIKHTRYRRRVFISRASLDEFLDCEKKIIIRSSYDQQL